MENEITLAGPLFLPGGSLAQLGWERRPLLDCSLEDVRFYCLRSLQGLLIRYQKAVKDIQLKMWIQGF
jgi:hypothetical protein